MTLTFGDFSDNNALPLPLKGLDGVMLKLYPTTYSRGHDWLVKAFAQAQGLEVGFYSPGDSTPTWADQKASAASLGVDLRDHAWALDFEFGYTAAAIRAVFADAAADGMTRRGLYQRAWMGLGQTWDWRSIGGNRDGNAFPNMVLDQYTTVPFDHDRSTLDAEAWAVATVASHQPQGGFLLALTDDQQKEVWYRALEQAAKLAGEKVRVLGKSYTVQLTDKELVVNGATTAADFGKANLGLYTAFDLGRVGG